MEDEQGVRRYEETSVDPGETNVFAGYLTNLISSMLGSEHLVSRMARRFEENAIQSDAVLIAMAARDGIYIPPVDYGDPRGYKSRPDGSYVVREYSTRLLDVARKCQDQNVSEELLLSWRNKTPQEVADVVRDFGLDIKNEEIDESNAYYAGRLSLYLLVERSS